VISIASFMNNQLRSGRLLEIDAAFAEFVARLAGVPQDPALTLLAALVSNAFSRHNETALPAARIARLDDLAEYLGEKRSNLPVDRDDWMPEVNRYLPVFSDGKAGITPLVRVGELLYLGRLLQAELFLRQYLTAHSRPLSLRSVNPAITALPMNEEQLHAAALGAGADFAVISGGPGTGKTTIVAVILALRPELPEEVILCAPTGKAQMRLREALNGQLQTLRVPPEKIAALGRITAATVHRLLGFQPGTGNFRHHRGNPLPCKLLIVDECSMIPLFLMKHLLEALRPDASVILLGDRFQLASVEPGAVFGDFCDLLKQHAPDHLAELTVSYRFPEGGPIAVLRDRINRDQAAEAWRFLSSGAGAPTVTCASLPETRGALAALLGQCAETGWFAGQRPYWRLDTLDEAWRQFETFRILTIVNSGPLGARKLNERAMELLELPTGYRSAGEAVMILENDYRVGIFNGSVGMFWFADERGVPLSRTKAARQQEARLLAFFPGLDDAGQPVWRGIPEEVLPEHTHAYAFTVHKAQGSDYRDILLLLPEAGSGTLLTREILYTGLTRAKQRAVIAVQEEVFRRAVEHGTQRVSGLTRLDGNELTPGAAGENNKNK